MAKKSKEKSEVTALIRIPESLYEELKNLKYDMRVDSFWEVISKLVEEHKEMNEIKHLNTYQDHISLIHRNRVVDVYVRVREGRNGRRLELYCDYDKSTDCLHVLYCWQNEKIRNALMEILEKGRTEPVKGDV